MAFFTAAIVSVLTGWCVVALIFIGTVWTRIVPADADRTMQLATSEDDSRAATDLVLVSACVISLVGVAFVLIHAGRSSGMAKATLTGLAVLAVVVSWATVQTVFTLRYAHEWWTTRAGVDFNEHEQPSYLDFAYLAFTIGMTYQVSDTDITTKTMRRTVLKHALLSFVFGTMIIAVMINVIAGLLT